MSVETVEIHAREHDSFLEEVHSFEFWFQSVEGYLAGHPYGVDPSTPIPDLDEEEKATLIATLSTYCVGELAALDGAGGMIGFAPNRQAKIFLATQAVDEARHLEVMLHRLKELGVTDSQREFESRANRNLLAFRKRLLEFVDAKDWEASLLAQNVILESMEFAAFHSHMKTADPRTAQMLSGVLKDERRHMGFGENDLGRHLAQAPHARARLREIKKELDALVLATFEDSQRELGTPASERPEIGRLYLETVARLGFDS
ncbi:MAG TPA: ferritin-like domain-containing protein [Deltaproteobacteria bacterium]|nr:ferritin-like domain-containing protein [Deltaproteobacteria bacterium]